MPCVQSQCARGRHATSGRRGLARCALLELERGESKAREEFCPPRFHEPLVRSISAQFHDDDEALTEAEEVADADGVAESDGVSEDEAVVDTDGVAEDEAVGEAVGVTDWVGETVGVVEMQIGRAHV